MDLTAKQQSEIAQYISNCTNYRETYNEVYDHVLNGLKFENKIYNISLVYQILEDDLGGADGIKEQEKLFQTALNKKCVGWFREELSTTFKWPGILWFGFCLMMYNASKNGTLNMLPTIQATFTLSIALPVYVHIAMYIRSLRYKKYSILDKRVSRVSFIGISIWNVFFFWLISQYSLIIIGQEGKIVSLLILFFFSSVFFRAFFNVYKEKIKVVAA